MEGIYLYSKLLFRGLNLFSLTSLSHYYTLLQDAEEKSKAKHFTQLERKQFLDILKKYKHIIEVKESDGVTLKDKDIAWSEICNEYNLSHLIS